MTSSADAATAKPTTPSGEMEHTAGQSPSGAVVQATRPTRWWSAARRKKCNIVGSPSDDDAHQRTDPHAVDDDAADPATASASDAATIATTTSTARRARIARAATFSLIPLLAMALALGSGYLKYMGSSASEAQRASVDSVQAAKDTTVAMLSYSPDTAEKSLTAARDRMVGPFRDSYGSLVHDVVVPGAKEKKVTAVATVPAAASIAATATHAVVLVYVNQAITMGDGAPTQTNSVVQVTLDRSAGRWLISGFEPK
jgi:Mce-associated membrane protein